VATVVEIRPKNDSSPISKACAAAENFGRFWFSETYSETFRNDQLIMSQLFAQKQKHAAATQLFRVA
jgi:hypothetical protein